MTKIFIIAGEHSGDQLGAELIASLKKLFPSMELRGIGGDKMLAAGLQDGLFPMENLSVMGIAEILPRIPKFLGLISKTVLAIKVFDPDIVITIDSPDFSFRVQKKLAKQSVRAKRIHYVAPTVWAWRADRAHKVAQFLDGMICLFPFEPIYFEQQGLRAVFAGHPVMQTPLAAPDKMAFRQIYGMQADTKIVGLFCGSRRAELEVSIPLYKEVIAGIRKTNPETLFVLPTLSRWRDCLRDSFAEFPNVIVSDKAEEKYAAFCAPDVAVAVSGTVALELAVAGIPHMIVYKMNRLTWEIVHRVVRTKYAHLGNILLGHLVYPEFIQENAEPLKITESVLTLLNDPIEQKVQREAGKKIAILLAPNQNENAADRAAAFIKHSAERN